MRVRPSDLADVFAHLVVLGIYIQFFPKVISESFLVALQIITLMLARAGLRRMFPEPAISKPATDYTEESPVAAELTLAYPLSRYQPRDVRSRSSPAEEA